MNTINIALIGCGAMGLRVAQQVLARDNRLRVTAVYDPDHRSTEAAQAAFGPELRVCSGYPEILNLPDVQWVLIASWNCHHAQQVVAAFEAGKHVFCQKPLALSVAECRAIKRAWESSGKMFNIGFTLRYSPHYRRIKKIVADGAIGQIVSLEFNETLDFNHGGYIMGDWRRLRENAGTHLLEKCSHDIDLVNWIVGSRARRVASFGGLDFFLPKNASRIDQLAPRADGKAAYRTWGGLIGLNPFTSDKDIIDNQVALIEYENGVRASFHANCNAAIPERRMYILGTLGTIRADVLAGKIELKRIGFTEEIQDLSTEGRGGHGGGDPVLAAELADSILYGKSPSVGLLEGLESAITCFAIDEALDTGTVVDVRRYWEQIEMPEREFQAAIDSTGKAAH